METARIAALTLDGLVLLIVVWMVVSGTRKGFLVSLVNAGGYLVSCIGAYVGSRVLALTVYQMFLRDRLIAMLSKGLTTAVSSADVTLLVSQALDEVPGMVRNMVIGFFGSQNEIADLLSGQVMATAQSVSTTLADQVIYPVVYVVLQSLLFMLLFAALRIILGVVTETLRNLRKFPLVGMADTLAGAGVGLVQAVLMLFVLVLIVRFLVSLSGGKIPFLNDGVIGQSYVFRLLYRLSPLSGSWSALE